MTLLDVRELRGVGNEIGRKAGTVAVEGSAIVRKTAFDIEGTSKSLAAVDTGTNRNSISTDITGDALFGDLVAEIGPTTDYGLWQEIGTSTQTGQPYMAPAYDRHIGPCLEALARMGGQVL